MCAEPRRTERWLSLPLALCRRRDLLAAHDSTPTSTALSTDTGPALGCSGHAPYLHCNVLGPWKCQTRTRCFRTCTHDVWLRHTLRLITCTSPRSRCPSVSHNHIETKDGGSVRSRHPLWRWRHCPDAGCLRAAALAARLPVAHAAATGCLIPAALQAAGPTRCGLLPAQQHAIVAL